MGKEKKYGDCFKVQFNILDYMDICPPPPTDIEQYLNWDKPTSKCFWTKGKSEAITPRYREQEAIRILKTGVWIFIKTMPVWIPPNYYFFLQNFTTGGQPPQFRIKRLKQIYYKLRVRNNPRALGTYTIKNRQDGETTMAMSDALWECAEGNLDYAAIGVQSKTRKTVTESCWRVYTMGWNSLDKWLKDDLYSDMSSGEMIAEKMKFMRPKTDTTAGRDILVTYGASVHNAFDSMNNMRRCILDEVNKWEECSFYTTFLNYEKFIAPGRERKGLFDIFSSPSDTSGRHNDEAYQFWLDSNPNELTKMGSTKSRVFRYVSDPLEGIEGFYDEFGDADPDEIYEAIMQKRKDVPAEFRMAEIRANALNDEERFGSTDKQANWYNAEGLKERSIYLLGTRFKNVVTQEPCVIYGNLEHIDGYIDGEVEFRMAEIQRPDVKDARFQISYLPQNKVPLQDYHYPPPYVEGCLGIDPYDKRNTVGKKNSNGAMVHWKFRDIHETGVIKAPTLIYSFRPSHPDIFYEDALRAAIFTRSMVQVEDKNANIINHFYDRGYENWLLSKIGQPRESMLKGDSPSGGKKNAFLSEMIGLINAATNTPLKAGDPYHLELNWFKDLIDDLLKFNEKDTHENDLSMAFGQSLLGAVKIAYTKIRQKNTMTGLILDYLN